MSAIISSTLIGNSSALSLTRVAATRETNATPAKEATKSTTALPSSLVSREEGTGVTESVSSQNDTEEDSSYSYKGVMTKNKSAKNNQAREEQNSDVIKKLKDRDKEVKAHEAAHIAAAGGLAQGGAKFTYQRGPDGQLYAIGGSVSIDIRPVSGDPEATMEKARVIRSAALAPAEPSSQDQAVAAAAAQMEQKARQEISQQQNSETTEGKGSSSEKNKVGSRKQEITQVDGRQMDNSTSSSSISATGGTLSSEFRETITSMVEKRLQTAITATQSTTFGQTLDIYA